MKKIKLFLSNPVARNSAIVFIGTMISNFGAYVYQVVVVRLMGPERYSEFAALLSLLFLLSVPATVLQTVLTKYFSIFKAREEIGEARSLFTQTLKFIGIGSILCIPIYLLVIPLLQNLLHIYSFESFIYLYLIVATTFLVTATSGALNGYQKFFESSAALSLLTFVRLSTGFVFAPISISLTIFGNVIANIVSIFLYGFSVRFLYTKSPKLITVKKSEIIKFAIPTLLSTLGMTAFFNMDVVLVKHFFDVSQAGIYASLTIFGKIIFFAATPIMIVIFPMIVERKEQKESFQSLFIMGFIGVLLLSFGIVFVYAFASTFITRLLFGDKFLTAAPYLTTYGIFMAFVTIVNYLMTVCLAVNKTKAGIIVFSGAVVQTCVMLLFHSSLSQLIASISLVSGALVCILLLYYRYERSV